MTIPLLVTYDLLYNKPLCNYRCEHLCDTDEELKRVLTIIINEPEAYRLISVRPKEDIYE